MGYLVGGFGSAFLLSYLIVYKGLNKCYFKKYSGLEEEGRKRVCFLVMAITFSIIIIAIENEFK